MIKAVIFDMDGLLIDSEPVWREAEKEIFSLVGMTLTDEMCFETVGLRIDEVVRHWKNKFSWDNYSESEIEEKIIQKVIELIKEKCKVLPGVYEAIHFFKKKNIPLAIASASAVPIIETVVEKLNIKNEFNVIHSAQNEPFGKPHPVVYLSTAKLLGVDPVHCLVFEDSFNGVIAAKAARMKVVAVPEDIHYGEERFHAADWQLRTLEEVEKWWNENILMN